MLQAGFSENDPRIVRHFALARHGEMRKRAYNLAKMDNVQDDEGSRGSLLAGILQTQEYANRPLSKEDMRKARGEALHKVLGDSFDADTSGAAVVTQAVLFENDEEIMSLRRTEENKRLEGLIERHNREAEARVVAVAPVESDDEILASHKALEVAELNAKIREANLRGRGSGDCAAPGPKKMYS